MSRSIRRHHARRIKAKATNVIVNHWHADPDPRRVGVAASTHCRACSCFLCSGHKDEPRHSVVKRMLKDGR